LEVKRSSERRAGWVVFCLLIFLVPLFFPSQSSAAQAENGDDFIITLALMAVADTRMDGVMDTADLANIRDLVDEYYTNQSYIRQSEETAMALSSQRDTILHALDAKIKNQKFGGMTAAVGLFGGLIDSNDEGYKKFQKMSGDDSDPFDLYNQALSQGPGPNPVLLQMLEERLSKNTDDSLKRNLDGQVATTIPDGQELVDQNAENEYDFYAGLRTGDYDPEEIVVGPLIITNWGAREVQVVVEYYEPPVGLNASPPSINVSIPPDASIYLDGFPQGNYVFCAHWLTSLDTDGDGLKDYDRMVTHGWISSAPNVDIRQTREVYVSSPFSPTPTGRCDGFKGEAPQTETFMSEFDSANADPAKWAAAAETPDEDLSAYDAPSDDATTGEVEGGDDSEPSGGADFWDQGDGDDEDGGDGGTTQPPDEGGTGTATGLNSAELVNQGTHDYTMTCENSGLSDTRSFSTSWEFTGDGVILGGENFYAKMSPGVYQNDYGTIITFYSGGYIAQSYYTETDSDGQTTTTETYCDAVIQ
jgi:hypothetical protein